MRHKAPHLNTDCYNFQKMDLVQNKTVKSHNKMNRRKKVLTKLQEQRQNARRRHGSHTKRINNSNSNSNNNVKELDLQLLTDYTYEDLNLAKKPKAIPKKVTTSNTGILPKFRHAAHRRNNKTGKIP